MSTGTETVAPLPLNSTPIYGEEEFDIPVGDSALHVETFSITFQQGARYRLEIENGDGGNDEVDYANITLNGIERFSDQDPLPGGLSTLDIFGLLASNDLTVELHGPAGSYINFSIYEDGGPWAKVIFDNLLRGGGGPPTVDTATFDLPEFARPPYGIELATGFADSTYVMTEGWVDLNGAEVLGDDDFGVDTFYAEAEVQLLDSANVLIVGIEEGDEAIVDVWVSASVFDTIPPTISITSPTTGFVTADDSVTVDGIATDQWSKQVFVFSGASYTEMPPLGEEDSLYTAKVPLLTEGANNITAWVSDIGWNQDSTTVVVTRDTNSPALTVSAPADGLVVGVDSVVVSGSVTDITDVTVTANSVPLVVGGGGTYSGSVSLSEGVNLVTVVATDEASNNTQIIRSVTMDTTDPTLTVTAPTDPTTTSADSIDVTGTVTDATAVTLTLNAVALTVDSVGGFSTRVALSEGANTLAFLATDEGGNTAVDTVSVTRTGGVSLPPDPSLVAPDVPNNVASTIGAATAFLYEGPDSIQTGVAPGTIDPVRVAVLRGRVLDRDGDPLTGVEVSILNHPEFGQTLTRADGEYDLVVNGGTIRNLRFVKSGYPEVQRRSELPWQDYAVFEDVVMTPLDTTVTTIDFSDPIEVARGTAQTDGDGTRQATLMFRQGTVATIELSNGTIDTLSSIDVRATEYTVGDDGPQAMPGALPPTTMYTYAVELSVDEAITAGVETVEFDQGVPLYVENFMDMPVGAIVPIGYYDREDGEWKAQPDGRVIEVVSIDSLGVASLNIDTIAGAEHPDTVLAQLNIDADELEAIGSTYSAGDELWRGEVTHFSPWDYNFSARLVDFFLDVWDALPDPSIPDFLVPDDCVTCEGSIISVEGQYVDERAPVVGTPYSLNYSSMRAPGRAASFSIDIPVFGDSIPSSVVDADVEIWIAGQHEHYTYTADSAVTHHFKWDGRDGFGRLLFGQQPVRTRITYNFLAPMVALIPGGAQRSSFGRPDGGGVAGTIARENPGVQIEWSGRIGERSLDRSLAGWSLDVHHSYDPIAGRLYLGNGTNRSSSETGPTANPIAGTIAGTGSGSFNAGDGEDELALRAPVSQPGDVAITPEGEVAILSLQHDRVRIIDATDTLRTIAGGGTLQPDSVPADSASISGLTAMSWGPDGSLWLASFGSSSARVHRVWPSGSIVSYGSSSSVGLAGDGGPVTADSVRFKNLVDIAAAPDGSVYTIHGDDTSINCLGGVCRRIRRIAPDGTVTTIAGTGGDGSGGDGGAATSATFRRPESIAVGPDGSVYIGDQGTIRRITPDGMIDRFAGIDQGVGFGNDYAGDGGPADSARIHVAARGLSVGRNGTVFFSQVGGAVRAIDRQGVVRTVFGTGVEGSSGDRGRPNAAQLDFPQGLAIAPDDALIVADADDNRIRRRGSALPGYDAGGHLIPSADGSMVYQFGPSGQHLQTLSALTGATLYSFEYDSANRLIGITDGNGLETTVDRDVNGDIESITGPFAHETTLTLGANGYLASVSNPANETFSFVVDSVGLLEEFITPDADTTRMTYDVDGRLTEHVDPLGRVSTLTRATGEGLLQVTFNRGGRSSVYSVRVDSLGATRRTTTDPAGNVSETLESLSGATTAMTPDSTERASAESGDPRFGIESPVVSSATLDLPSGLTSVLSAGRRVELTDTLDPLSLVSVLDTVVLNGRTYRSEYVTSTQSLTATTPEGRETVSVLDSLERLVTHKVPGLDSVVFSYDTLGLLGAATQGSRSWAFDYDASGRLQAATDPLGRTDSLFYDLGDRVRRQVLADGDSIVYGYDTNGNLTSLAPPGRPAHTFNYNAAGLDSIYNPPDVAGLSEDRTFYTYNTNRELIEILRPDSATIDFVYDSAGRVDSVTVPRGVLDYGYSATTGQLTSITAPGSEGLSFTYDGVLPTSESWTGTIAGSVAFGYDADLRLSGLAVEGDTVEYGYDDDGLLTAAGDLVLVRDSLNGLLRESTLDSVSSVLSYNTFGEPSADSTWFGSTLLLARTYARDDLGRITEVIDWADSVTTIWGYGYDDIGRLETVTQDSVSYASYAYDANGNRLTRTSSSGTETGTYDAQDRLLTYDGATYTYTPAGELEERVEGTDTTRYDYDALGNLTEVELPDGTLIEYVIDGRNRRIGRSVDGDLVQGLLYGDQLNPVAELDSVGDVVSRFVYGSKANVPDYMIRGSDTLRVISDHLGSVRMVVDASDGSVVQKLSYDAWGRVLEDTNPGYQPFGFAGGIWDGDVGLVRFGARDYDAVAGRWTAKDPIGFAGDHANVFAYAMYDPTNYFDPVGTSATSAAGAFAMGFGYGVAGAVATGATLSGLALLSPPLAAAAAVAGAGYAAFQLGIAAQRVLGGFDPWTGSEICVEQRVDEAAGLAGLLLGGGVLSGPRGPLFGRGPLRSSGQYGLFNRGNSRIGWSWKGRRATSGPAWSRGRNNFSIHGGTRGQVNHYHFDLVVGPRS